MFYCSSAVIVINYFLELKRIILLHLKTEFDKSSVYLSIIKFENFTKI